MCPGPALPPGHPLSNFPHLLTQPQVSQCRQQGASIQKLPSLGNDPAQPRDSCAGIGPRGRSAGAALRDTAQPIRPPSPARGKVGQSQAALWPVRPPIFPRSPFKNTFWLSWANFASADALSHAWRFPRKLSWPLSLHWSPTRNSRGVCCGKELPAGNPPSASAFNPSRGVQLHPSSAVEEEEGSLQARQSCWFPALPVLLLAHLPAALLPRCTCLA